MSYFEFQLGPLATHLYVKGVWNLCAPSFCGITEGRPTQGGARPGSGFSLFHSAAIHPNINEEEMVLRLGINLYTTFTKQIFVL